MNVTLNLPEPVLRRLREIAKQNHRSLSGQVAFFLQQGVSNQHTPAATKQTTNKQTA